MLVTFPTKNLVEVEKSYNGKLSTSCTSTVLLHCGTFLKGKEKHILWKQNCKLNPMPIRTPWQLK